MTDYIKHKEYKLPNGRTVTADFNELGIAKITIQAMDALFDILNSSDVVEVVRCKDCMHYDEDLEECCHPKSVFLSGIEAGGFCHYGERKDD